MYVSGDGDLFVSVIKYLDDDKHAIDYYTWDGPVPGRGYDAIITSGAAAKILVAVEISGRDPLLTRTPPGPSLSRRQPGKQTTVET